MEVQDLWLSGCAAAVFIALFVFVGLGIGRKKAGKWIPNLRNKHVVITGASRGIGLALAMEALREGGFVTLISYDAPELHQAVLNITQQEGYPLDNVCTKVADVGDYDGICKAIRESFEWRPIDILICNAGVARTGYVGELPLEDIDLVIRTNFSGVVYTIHAALPLMKRRGNGRPASVVLMGSLGSLHPVYGHSIYTATKHAVKAIAECLRLELFPYNIRVTLSCPNFVRTRLIEDAGKDESIEEIMKVVDLYDKNRLEDPTEVAKATMEGAKEGSFLVTNKRQGLLLSAFSRGLFPAESMGRTMMELIAFTVCRLGTHLFMAVVRRTIRRHCNTSPLAKAGGNADSIEGFDRH